MRQDRLSGLMNHFDLTVDFNLHNSSENKVNVLVIGWKNTSLPKRIILSLAEPLSEQLKQPDIDEQIFVSGFADWGGYENPFVASLDDLIELDIPATGELNLLASLLIEEHTSQRCGSFSVLNRLAEILIVLILRTQLEKGSTSVGLIGGLSDSRISRAIVSMHEDPGHSWSNTELASVSGLSLSRFYDIFSDRVGKSPMAYLRSYRLTLATNDIEKGTGLKIVARRYGYGSGEALCRALKKNADSKPQELQPLKKQPIFQTQ
tara:strand:- start:118499 stop:119287 length:789 start_codon:yes stop_codon:yes gene_type:complete